MSLTECEQLEAYLAGELPSPVAEKFKTHLTACEPCRTIVDQQKWLDSLLHETVTHPAPNELRDSIGRAIIRAKQRKRITYGALAAAATLFFAFLLQRPEPSRQETTQPAAMTPQQPVATFVGSADMIVVQHDSPYPDVTIIQVYPTVTALNRWKQESTQRPTNSTLKIPGEPS